MTDRGWLFCSHCCDVFGLVNEQSCLPLLCYDSCGTVAWNVVVSQCHLLLGTCGHKYTVYSIYSKTKCLYNNLLTLGMWYPLLYLQWIISTKGRRLHVLYAWKFTLYSTDFIRAKLKTWGLHVTTPADQSHVIFGHNLLGPKWCSAVNISTVYSITTYGQTLLFLEIIKELLA